MVLGQKHGTSYLPCTFSVRWGNKYLICRPRLEAYLNQLMVRERNKNDVGLEENHGVS